MPHRLMFLRIGNDAHLRLAGVTHALSLSLVTSANIVFTLVASGGFIPVPGQTFPSSMTLANSEQALWIGPLLNSLALTADAYYQARVTLDSGQGNRAFWLLPFQAVNREE